MAETKQTNTQKLVFTAVMLALATALSVIPAIQLPFGGKTTIASMVPILLIVFKYDFKWSLLSTFTYSVIQLLLSVAKVLGWGLSPVVLIGCLALDYILAYTVLVVAHPFRKSGVSAIIGSAVALAARFIVHLISGMVLWGYITEKGFIGALWYSITYNGAYMLPELILTVIVMAALVSTKAYKKIVD